MQNKTKQAVDSTAITFWVSPVSVSAAPQASSPVRTKNVAAQPTGHRSRRARADPAPAGPLPVPTRTAP
ncbi:hypothetical protein [Streptomyces sp. NBC_00448]|uniref:hypothetical protein n=1 Tax=Streptomyces sp. NBC_00448 TaxID=2903652 RepID=UPI002E1D504F